MQDRCAMLFLPGAALCIVTAAFVLLLPDIPPDGDDEEEEERGRLVEDEGAGGRATPGLRQLCAPDTARATALAATGVVGLQLTGINAVMFYCSNFFDAAHFKQRVLGTVFVMAWNWLTTFIAGALVERRGRRGLYLPAMGVITVSMLLLAPFDHISDDAVKSALCFVCLGAYIAAFEIGPGTLFWIVTNELFRPDVGEVAFPVMNAGQWLLTLAVTFVFPLLNDAMGSWVFLLFAAPGAYSFAFAHRYLPETKGKTRTEIQAALAPHAADVVNCPSHIAP